MPNTFAEIQNEMRNIAKELLESGEATMVIGWEKGALPYQSTPVMMSRPTGSLQGCIFLWHRDVTFSVTIVTESMIVATSLDRV